MATYYIRIDTFWQNSPDSWFGPYPSKQLADEAVETSGIFDNRLGFLAADVKNQTRCLGVYGATYSKNLGRTDENTYAADILPPDIEQLRIIQEYYVD